MMLIRYNVLIVKGVALEFGLRRICITRSRIYVLPAGLDNLRDQLAWSRILRLLEGVARPLPSAPARPLLSRGATSQH